MRPSAESATMTATTVAASLRAGALVVVLLACLCGQAVAQTESGFHYLNPASLDLTVFLPPPPDAGSAQESADEHQVAFMVAARSQAQLANARADSARSVFFFAPSVGPQFASARYPLTAGFFDRIGSDVEDLIHRAKAYWDRPRPDGVVKKHGSYPSGHAAFAASSAIVLAQLLPCKRGAIFGQALTFAENRIILGVHYPSDIAAGWTAGTLAVSVMMHDPAFQRDFAAAKAELQTICPS